LGRAWVGNLGGFGTVHGGTEAAIDQPGVQFSPRVGNLSVVAGQKQTAQGMAGRSRLDFPPTIPLLFVVKIWEF